MSDKFKKGSVLRKWVAGIELCPTQGIPGHYSYFHLVYGKEMVVNEEREVKTVLEYGEPVYVHDLNTWEQSLFRIAVDCLDHLSRKAKS